MFIIEVAPPSEPQQEEEEIIYVPVSMLLV